MINYIVVGQDRQVTLAVLQAVRSFTDAGCMVIGGHANRGLRWSSLCEQHATVRFDGTDDDALVGLVNDLGRYTRHMVLIPADGDAIRMVNRVAGRLTVAIAAIPDTPTLAMLDDRWRFQRLCRQHRLPVPESRLIGGEAEPDFVALAAEFGVPFIVKPVSRSQPGGSQLIRCRQDLWRLPPRGLWLAQRIADGVDVSINLLADRGQPRAFAIAGLDRQQAARFQAELQQLASRLCHASAFNGAMRLRARVNLLTAEIKLIDCVPYFCADLSASILAGLNLVAESVQPTPRAGMQLVTQIGPAIGHPLARACWSRLAAPDEGGRLLRAMSMDLYSLSLSTGDVMRAAWRTARRPAPARPRLAPAMSRPARDATAR